MHLYYPSTTRTTSVDVKTFKKGEIKLFYKDTFFQNCNKENCCLQVDAYALKLNAAIKIIKHIISILTPKIEIS